MKYYHRLTVDIIRPKICSLFEETLKQKGHVLRARLSSL